MFKTLALAAALFATSLSTPAVAAPQSYQFDKAHTHILFFIDHLGFSKMVGQFRGFDGTLDFDPADPAASSVSVSIQVASVATDVEKLDEHLRKPDFFDAEKFPTMTFASTSVAAAGEGKLKVVGNLTLLGVSQMVGGENNAFTNNDITNYYIQVPSVNIETAFWLESDRMLSLAFSEKSLETQRSVVIEEFKQRYLNQPYGDVWLKLRDLLIQLIHTNGLPSVKKFRI